MTQTCPVQFLQGRGMHFCASSNLERFRGCFRATSTGDNFRWGWSPRGPNTTSATPSTFHFGFLLGGHTSQWGPPWAQSRLSFETPLTCSGYPPSPSEICQWKRQPYLPTAGWGGGMPAGWPPGAVNIFSLAQGGNFFVPWSAGFLL